MTGSTRPKILLLTLAVGCSRGSKETHATDLADTAPSETATTTVWGRVVDSEGEPVAAATVVVGDGHEGKTSAAGYFSVSHVPVGPTVISVDGDHTHGSTSQRRQIVAEQPAYVSLQVPSPTYGSIPDASAATELGLGGGLLLQLPGGGMTYEESGETTTGRVEVSASTLTSHEDLGWLPGPLVTTDDDGEEVPIEVYGAAEVRLQQGTRAVALKANVELALPVVEGVSVPEDATLETYWYSPTDGIWTATGDAEVQGDRLHTTVSHFSTYLIGRKVPMLGCIRGVLHLDGLTSAEGIVLAATTAGGTGGALVSVQASLAANGSFELAVPEEATMALVLLDPRFPADLGTVSVPPKVEGCAEVEENLSSEDDDGDGLSEDAGDCDDVDATVYPEAPGEAQNDGVDQDCDGLECPDKDDDGYSTCDGDGATHDLALDCDDGDYSRNPGATEICNSIDDNCDGPADNDVPHYAVHAWYPDCDEDGFYDPWYWDELANASGAWPGYTPGCAEDARAGRDIIPYEGCAQPSVEGVPAWSWYPGDCDDGDANYYPGAKDAIEGDSWGPVIWKDYSCDGRTGRSSADADGQSPAAGDCIDQDLEWMENIAIAAGIGAIPMDDTCNGIDDDCDGKVDEDGDNWWYPDADGDEYGKDGDDGIKLCAAPDGSYVQNRDDCDDSDPNTAPGKGEKECGPGCTTCLKDRDGDGYGDQYVVSPISAGRDCDDEDNTYMPDAVDNECDGLDQNCSRLADDGAPFLVGSSEATEYETSAYIYTSIQDAINDVPDGETVCILPGTYYENLIIEHPVTLMGRDGSTETIIDAEEMGRVVYIDSGDTAITQLTGLTLTGGYEPSDAGGGIYCSSSEVSLEDTNLDGNTASDGAAVYAVSSGLSLVRVQIANNTQSDPTTSTGSVVVVKYGSVDNQNVAALDNEICNGAVFYLYGSSRIPTSQTFTNIIVGGNIIGTADTDCVGYGPLYVKNTELTLIHADIARNTSTLATGVYLSGTATGFDGSWNNFTFNTSDEGYSEIYCATELVMYPPMASNFYMNGDGSSDSDSGSCLYLLISSCPGTYREDPMFESCCSGPAAMWDLHLTVESTLTDISCEFSEDAPGDDIGAYGGEYGDDW